jgi:amphi-Trp domain-containing protein
MKAERRKHRRKAQAVLTMDQIAEQLRALASQVEGGTFVLGDKELDLPDHADFEISYKLKKKGGHQIEVEIEWGKVTDAPLLSTD